MTSIAKQIASLHRQAQQSMQQGQLKQAHQHCLAILKLDQTFADAWFLCGVIAAHNGQSSKATQIFIKAINLAPDNAEYRAELGKHFVSINQPEKAWVEAARGLALEPRQPPALNTLGTVFSHVGEHAKALQCFDRAIEQLKKRKTGREGLSSAWQAELHFNRAASLQFSGQFDAAQQAYEASISLQASLFKAHSGLATLRRQTVECNHLPRLEKLHLAVKNARDQLHLGHALAKEHEDLGHYTRALEHLRWAKQAQATAVDYKTDTDVQLFTGIKQLFDNKVFAQSLSACDSPEPIFVVGMPRSGTTLVEQILSSHSDVYAAGELQSFPVQVKRLTGTDTPDVLDLNTFNAWVNLSMPELGSAYIQSTRPRTGHTARFIDKLPINFLYLGLIKLALPNAKLVCLRRDPMDTCLSNYRQLFATNFKHYHYNYDLLDCGRYFIQFDQLMNHWQKVMPGTVYDVGYETLVEKPEETSKALLEHCNLQWQEQCLTFHQRRTSVATPSSVQVRQGIYTSSVNRWKRYGAALQPLYDLLQKAGYYP